MCDEKFWEEYEDDVRQWMPKKSEKAIFYRDGIIGDENKYRDQTFRPLFIFREVNDVDGCDKCGKDKQDECKGKSIRIVPGSNGRNNIDFCKCNEGLSPLVSTNSQAPQSKEKDINGRTWTKVAQLVKIIKEHTAEDIGFNELAVINLEKIGGGKNVRSKESLNTLCCSCHAARFRDMLSRQIEAINPTFIICGGTYYEVVNNDLLKRSVKAVLDISGFAGLRKAYLYNDIIVIDMYHPSASISYEAFDNAMRDVFNYFRNMV